MSNNRKVKTAEEREKLEAQIKIRYQSLQGTLTEGTAAYLQAVKH